MHIKCHGKPLSAFCMYPLIIRFPMAVTLIEKSEILFIRTNLCVDSSNIVTILTMTVKGRLFHTFCVCYMILLYGLNTLLVPGAASDF